jgi:ABC-type branched-subunit amino acid transport system substrate-binding protein
LIWVTGDCSSGYDYEQAFTKGYTDAGGNVIDSIRMPIAAADFVPFVQRVKDSRPEALYVFVPGGKQAMQFMKALRISAWMVSASGSSGRATLRPMTSCPTWATSRPAS